MNIKFGRRGLFLLAVLFLLGGCLELEIVAPAKGDEFVLGERIEFLARTKEAAVDEVHWIVDGAPMGTGASFTAADLAVGWHEVAARLKLGDTTVSDSVRVQVIVWKSMPAPHGKPVKAMARDGTRRETWLAVPGEGVYRVEDHGAFKLFSAAAGDLPSDDVRDVALYGGQVWVATGAGAAHYDGLVWKVDGLEDGLPSEDVRALAVDAEGLHLWLATPAGIAAYGDSFWHFHAHPLAATSLAAREGAVWAGTEGDGILRFDGESWGELGASDHSESIPVGHLLPDPVMAGRVLLAIETKGLASVHDGGSDYLYFDRFEPLRVRDMAVEKAARALWIAEWDGLGILRRSSEGLWRRYDAGKAMPGIEGAWQAMTVDGATGDKWLVTRSHIVSLAASGLSREAVDLPDLVAFPPSSFNLKEETEGLQLRFDVTLANLGSGPLEIEAHPDPRSGQKVAVQNLYSTDTRVGQNPVGEFFFHGHRDHNHYHFAGLTHYQLRKVRGGGGVGSIVRQATKVSWCLSDDDRLIAEAPGQRYSCKGDLQGMSRGWGDTYYARLFGQSVSIEGVPPGEYWVVVVTSGVFAEKDYRNNTGRARIRLDRAGVEVLEKLAPEGVSMDDLLESMRHDSN